MTRTYRILSSICLCVGFLGATSGAFAAGFALLEQSAEGMGNAYAGSTAGYGDGSEVAYNPAAMSWIQGGVVSHSSHLVVPKAEFTNTGSSNPLLGIPLSGSDGTDGGEAAYVPSFYYVHQASDDLHLGFGVHTPFGLATKYDDGWVGRYQAIKSELITVSLSPAVSYKVTPDFSIGGALNVLYADAELSNAVDFGTIGFATLGAPTAAALGLSPQMNDGFAKVTGDDWGVGFTLGGSYRYGEDSRVGLAWHSRISMDLSGDADFTVPAAAAPLTATGFFTDTGANAHVGLPESIVTGIKHNLSREWSLLGELAWTHWSRFEELRVKFDNGQPDSVVDEGWNTTWRYSLGVQYRPVDALTLKAGWTYDEEAVADAAHRTPRIPDSRRNWMAFGADYDLTEQLAISVAYAHLFATDEGTITSDGVGNTVVGTWDSNVNLVSVGLTYDLG